MVPVLVVFILTVLLLTFINWTLEFALCLLTNVAYMKLYLKLELFL